MARSWSNARPSLIKYYTYTTPPHNRLCHVRPLEYTYAMWYVLNASGFRYEALYYVATLYSNPLVQKIGNHTLADLTNFYKKYKLNLRNTYCFNQLTGSLNVLFCS
jgi:hypothetical protein